MTPYDPSRKLNRGFSMIEILLVVGLMTIALLAVFIAYPMMRTSQQVESQVRGGSSVLENTRTYFRGRGTFGLTRATALQLGLGSEENLTSPWGNVELVGVTDANRVTPCTAASTDCNSLAIIYRNVPEAACAKFVNKMEPYMHTVAVNTTVLKSDSEDFALMTMTTACSNDTQSVTFSPN